MSDFNKAFNIIIGAEGGYVNDPKDPGGETNFGISRRAYPNEDIKNLNIERARQIYQKDYWNACRCGELPDKLALFVFDAAVNQGVRNAIQMLQASLGTKEDGIIGQHTMYLAWHSPEVAPLFMAARASRYMDTRNFDRFGRGWLKRLFAISLEA